VPWVITRDTKAIDLFTDLGNKKNISLELVELKEGEMLVLKPGQVCLAETQEAFNLPNNIVAEFVLKSSQARNFLGHELAGYADPGFHNSVLTMEFKNDSQHGFLIMEPGKKVGQCKFYEVDEVPEDKSYAVVGQYNNCSSVSESLGIR
jgi:dCTP deaminase